MGSLIRLTILGLLVEIAGILSFIGIARTPFYLGKQTVIISFLLAVIVLLVIAVRVLPFRKLFLLAIFMTVGFVIIYQTLGFTFFSGLVKDMELLSFEHLEATGTIMILTFCTYMTIIFVILGIRKLFKI